MVKRKTVTIAKLERYQISNRLISRFTELSLLVQRPDRQVLPNKHYPCLISDYQGVKPVQLLIVYFKIIDHEILKGPAISVDPGRARALNTDRSPES